MSRARTRGELIVGVLWLVALAVAAYLTFEHFTGSQSLACAEGAVVNCAAVTSSEYAYLFGVPVALLGLLYAAGGTAFAWLVAPRVPLGRGRLLGAAYTGAGVLFVLYLIWAELQLRQLCSWCTVVHVVTIALFVYYLAIWLGGRDPGAR